MERKLEHIIWSEKHRPNTFEDLVLESSEKKVLQNALKNPKSIPNFLFFSHSAGTGKTSCALLIIKLLECDSLILNASDERGIQEIRTKVKVFAETLSFDPKLKRAVLLNEAPGLTNIAQNSLRDIMEHYASNVFFILTANKFDKVIEPIRSRCIAINFNSPPKAQIYDMIDLVASKENLELDDEDLKRVVETFYPDMRKMILTLQKVSLGYSIKDLIAMESIYAELIGHIKQGRLNEVRTLIFSGKIIITNFIDYIFNKTMITEGSIEQKASLCKSLVFMERFINNGVEAKMVLFAYLPELRKGL